MDEKPSTGFYARARCPQDDAALLSIFNDPQFQTFAATRAPFTDIEEFRLWLADQSRRRFEIVGAWDSEVVGFGGLYPMEDYLSHIGWIILGVRSGHRQRGIGAALLQALLAASDFTLGLRRMQLAVFADNAPAIALYERHGFVVEGRHRSFVRRGDDFVDGLTMARLFDIDDFRANGGDEMARMCEVASFWRDAPGA